jgi:hypothetical protein
VDLDSSATEVAGYRYLVTITKLRSTNQVYRVLPSLISSALTGGGIGFAKESIRSPSDPISGTYQLTFNQ